MADLDLKRITPLEWAGIGAGLFAFIVSFFPWASIDLGDAAEYLVGFDTSVNAWDAAFIAWFPVLLLVAAAVIVFLPHVGVEVPKRTLNWLILSGVALLLLLLRLLTLESEFDPGVGLFLGILAAVVSGAAALLAFRAEPKPTVGPAGPYPAA